MFFKSKLWSGRDEFIASSGVLCHCTHWLELEGSIVSQHARLMVICMHACKKKSFCSLGTLNLFAPHEEYFIYDQKCLVEGRSGGAAVEHLLCMRLT